MSKVAVILADGMEEVEAVTPIDFLRRAGIDVVTVGLTGTKITGSHNIPVLADVDLKDFSFDVDGLVIPGGMPGSAHIAADSRVRELIVKFDREKKLVAAICAAPALVLGGAGVLEGRRYTCFPGMESQAGPGGEYTAGRLEVDGHIITGIGAGGAAEFAAGIIGYFLGQEAADKIMQTTVQPGA